jgi:hypothetical protein
VIATLIVPRAMIAWLSFVGCIKSCAQQLEIAAVAPKRTSAKIKRGRTRKAVNLTCQCGAHFEILQHALIIMYRNVAVTTDRVVVPIFGTQIHEDAVK